MPAWSPEIANEFIKLARADSRELDQMQLQKLVYVAHGWCLALDGEPLTGDRPEAWEFGPVYRRLADALVQYGCDPVTREILQSEAFPQLGAACHDRPAQGDLTRSETETITHVYQNYGTLHSSQLSSLTRRGDTPWKTVFENGVGAFRDIPHKLVMAQFAQFLTKTSEDSA